MLDFAWLGVEACLLIDFPFSWHVPNPTSPSVIIFSAPSHLRSSKRKNLGRSLWNLKRSDSRQRISIGRVPFSRRLSCYCWLLSRYNRRRSFFFYLINVLYSIRWSASLYYLEGYLNLREYCLGVPSSPATQPLRLLYWLPLPSSYKWSLAPSSRLACYCSR